MPGIGRQKPKTPRNHSPWGLPWMGGTAVGCARAIPQQTGLGPGLCQHKTRCCYSLFALLSEPLPQAACVWALYLNTGFAGWREGRLLTPQSRCCYANQYALVSSSRSFQFMPFSRNGICSPTGQFVGQA